MRSLALVFPSLKGVVYLFAKINDLFNVIFTVAFEGSLGKVTLANVHHPRKLMDVSSREQEEDDQV